jgi:hypothetical protein
VLVARGEGDPDPFIVDQVWTLHLETGLWSDRTPYPRPTHEHAGVFVPEYGGMMIYGGSSHRPAKEHSTWLLRTR